MCRQLLASSDAQVEQQLHSTVARSRIRVQGDSSGIPCTSMVEINKNLTLMCSILGLLREQLLKQTTSALFFLGGVGKGGRLGLT